MKADNLENIYELSPMQQGMLFHSLYAPESGIYCEQTHCTLSGVLDIPAFQRAWQKVVSHHSILRTAVYWADLETPLQVVLKQIDLPWQLLDWQELSPDEQQHRLENYLFTDRTLGFDFSQAPLMHLALIQMTRDTYRFIWSYHHLLLDGWSLFLVLGDIFTCYDAYCQGRDPHLAYNPPYSDYIAWLQQQDMHQAEIFWKHTLHGFKKATSLRVDREPATLSSQEQAYQRLHIRLSQETTEALRSLARQHQLTLSTLIQGAWAFLLSYYSDQEDVVFGTTVSGRPVTLSGVESMIGLFINTLPMRVQVPSNISLLSWLQHIQTQHVELRQYEYSPLVQIQGWSDVPRGTPLFESILVFENYPVQPAPQRNSKLRIGSLQAVERTNYPLTVLVAPGSDLFIQIHYDSNRFATNTIERMLGHIQTILERIVTQPHQQLGNLSLLSPAEYQQIIVDWNATRTEFGFKNQTLHPLLEAQAERTPETIAIVYENQHLTYQELHQRANQLAHYLQKLGVGPEVLVGVCLDRTFDLIISLLAIFKAGGAYIPLDPKYPSSRLAWILQDSQAQVVITQQQWQKMLVATQQPVHLVCLETTKQSIEREALTPPLCQVQPDHLAYGIYTSGSTGKPKGAAIAHRSAVAMLAWALHNFTPEQYRGVLAATSICFDLSVFELWLPLCGGGTVLLANDIFQLLSLPAAQAVTLLNTVPSAIDELLHQGEIPEAVSTINLAGEALPARLVQQLYALKHIQQVYNLYGPSEDTTYSTWAQAPREPGKSVPIGRPIDNTQAYVLNEHMQPVPLGVPGELYLGGEGLARGYLRRANLTAERFLPNPFSSEPGKRLYRTGDLVYHRPDGELEFLGRKDEQVKLRGYRIEPGEIETILSQHPGILQCVVIMREDIPGDQRLVAYLVPRQGQTIPLSDLRTMLQSELPLYMLPSTFVQLETLPRTTSGKIDRHALPVPESRPLESETTYVVPRTELEQAIAAIWRDVLQRETVGIHDNFFDLGGHSLHMLRVQNTLSTSLNKTIPLIDMFKYPTISALAKYFSQPPGEEPSYQPAYGRAETRRTSMRQQRQHRQQSQVGLDQSEEEE